MEDITGRRYGRLVVLGRAEDHITSGGYPVTMWHVKCDCGTEKIVRGSDMKAGKINSCGCIIRDRPAARKHGETGSKLFYIYYGMKDRCENQKNKAFKYYGGKGIAICREWDTFLKFREWARENGYEEGLSIDRIDVNGDYCPENCRWITMYDQHNNTSRTIRITANEKTMTAVEWSKETGIDIKTIRSRLKHGWTGEEAVTIPKGERRH